MVCSRVKSLYSGKSDFLRAKSLYSGKSGYFLVKVVVIGKKRLCSGKSVCIRE